MFVPSNMFSLSHDEIRKLISEHINEATKIFDTHYNAINPEIYDSMVASQILFIAGNGSPDNLERMTNVLKSEGGTRAYMSKHPFVITLKAKD